MINKYILKSYIRRFANNTAVGRHMLDIRNALILHKRGTAYKRYGIETAKAAIDACANSGIRLFLFAGSLLGAIRDGRLIDYDLDLDLAFLQESDISWATIEKALTKAGYQKVREFAVNGSIVEQAYSDERIVFDVFALSQQNNRDVARNYFLTSLPDEIYFNSKEMSVYYNDLPTPTQIITTSVSGIELPVPANAEQLLEKIYGPNWRVPDPNWVSGTGMTLMEGKPGERLLWIK